MEGEQAMAASCRVWNEIYTDCAWAKADNSFMGFG